MLFLCETGLFWNRTESYPSLFLVESEERNWFSWGHHCLNICNGYCERFGFLCFFKGFFLVHSVFTFFKNWFPPFCKIVNTEANILGFCYVFDMWKLFKMETKSRVLPFPKFEKSYGQHLEKAFLYSFRMSRFHAKEAVFTDCN